jgi:uncharacterized membrane protein YeaQ/YmgE (transglycosylase-associated protein family)
MHDILITCIVSAIAGWIAGALVNFNSGSFLLDILIGIVGGYIAVNWIFHGVLNLTHNHYVDLVITSTIGAAILSLVLKLIRRRSRP